MNCDAVLLEGTCVLNEGHISGVPHPLTKFPISLDSRNRDTVFDMKRHGRRHCLLAGSMLPT